ncbi:MAG TPA: hypothetical protein VNQ73_22805 [Ilumatobacter sp.]|nr:hypothetical protein [Ilumatobacter sp.]
MKHAIAIATGVAVIALGGCGGEPDQAGLGVGQGAASPGDGAAGANDGDSEYLSPLAELLGWNTDPVEQRRQELEIQELAGQCMREYGWEYTPVDYGVHQAPVIDGVDMSDPQAYGEKYGYGVMYNYEVSSGPGAAAIDRA